VKKSKKPTASAVPTHAADTGRKASGKANGGVQKDYGAAPTALGFKPEQVIPFDNPEADSFQPRRKR
jgi:SLT domain-containing protein